MKQAPIEKSRRSALDRAGFAHPNLPMQLLAVREQLMSRFRPLLAAQGLTEQQWRVLRELSEQEGLEPRQLCQRCVILSPSLVGILQRMEAEGWIRRKRSSIDQRRLAVFLSAKGKRVIARLNPMIHQVYGDLQALIGAPALQRLQDQLALLSTQLGDPGKPDPSRKENAHVQ
jgi:homoprotocatechuate degradation regulator HpaR